MDDKGFANTQPSGPGNLAATPAPAPVHANPRAFQPKERGANTVPLVLGAVLLLLLAAAGGWYWWQQRSAVPVPAPAAPAPVAAAPAPAPAPAAPATIQHPVEPEQPAATPPPPLTLDNADPALRDALTALLGSQAVSKFLQTDDFVRRSVATIDNLGRAQAAPRLWPVRPSDSKFSVEGAVGSQTIAAANAARHDAFVAFATSVDPKRAAALYRRFYPLFQKAYQELGYPNAYFNDRVVAVIDQMLATPEPAGPLAVQLIEVKGPMADAPGSRPWTRYEFADPALEALPAGSKLLLRMGPQHAAKLKAQLRALRAEIARRK